MKPRRRLVVSIVVGAMLALVLGLLAVVRGRAQNGRGKDLNKTPHGEIDAYLQRQLEALNIPGASLAIVEGDRIVHTQGFGTAAPGGQKPAAQTPFFIGSLTKSFTALAIMQLVEAGKVALDAPVQRYLPWFTLADPQAAAQITVRHLLNQTSGFTQIAGMTPLANFDNTPGAAERQARALASYAPPRPVGSRFEYSNTNYSLLGLIVEAESGVPYAEYVQSRIFAPLQMAHSHTAKAAAQKDGLAVGHQHWFGVPVARPHLRVPEGSLAAGQLISSAEDMAHYLIAHANAGSYQGRQVLSPHGMAQLHEPAVAIGVAGMSSASYGMGWFVESTEAGPLWWHSGSVPDFSTVMAVLPERKQALVLLANANHMTTMFALPEAGKHALALYAGTQPRAVPAQAIPWATRSFLLIPLLQMVGVWATYRLLRRWQQDPASRPHGWRLWLPHVGAPLTLNLALVATAAALLASGMLSFLLLFLGDVSLLLLASGGFALVWSALRGWKLHTTLRPAVGETPRARPLRAGHQGA